MRMLLFFLSGAITMALLVITVNVVTRRFRLKRRKRIKEKCEKSRLQMFNTYLKVAVSIIILHGFTLTTMSYILAWYEKDPVCSVSEIIVKEIIAPITVYAVSKTWENTFEKNKLTFSTPIDFLKSKEEDEPEAAERGE